MTPTESRSNKSPKSWLVRPLGWLLTGLGFLIRFLLVAWATLAIYWSNLPWYWLRLVLALAFLAFGIYALWRKRNLRNLLVFSGLFLVVFVWYLTIQPSHDRHWRPEVAVMPRAVIDGDRVLLKNVRNFDYRTADDFTVRYIDREVSLSHLTSADFFVSYWMPGPVAHTFVSFNFDNAPPVSISIEARPEVGRGFEPIASIFKQFGLIYVVAEERDVVRVRTNYRHENVYLYRIETSPESAGKLFMVYVDRINELADRPEFYQLLSNSCTINIVRYARMAGKAEQFDLRFWLNGFSDRGLYRAGLLNPALPFARLRRRSWINQFAQAAGDAPDFSQRIRAPLPLTPQPAQQ
jgi:membrane-bound metal-dependent hydrolase YbcI (DUF457 family)